jgi:uncharacterized protein with GYD domain
MKPKNFPGRVQQRRLDALQRMIEKYGTEFKKCSTGIQINQRDLVNAIEKNKSKWFTKIRRTERRRKING